MNFGPADYWRMYKAKGIRLPLAYFFQAQLFDLLHGTETHTWMPKEQFTAQPDNFGHGVLYMCSWTNEVKNAFQVARRLLKDEFEDYTFVDIGCGKGKVVLVWQRALMDASFAAQAYGVDYYGPFIELARENHRKVFGTNGNYACADATRLDFAEYGKKIIAYLYNPFDEVILAAVIERLSGIPSLIVYNNPVHAELFERYGYKMIYRKRGFHPNAHTAIFSNCPRTIADAAAA